ALHGPEGDGGLGGAHRLDVDDRELRSSLRRAPRLLGVLIWIRYNLGQPHDRPLIPGVVDERLVPLAGCPEGLQGRRVGYAAPDGLLFPDQVGVRVCTGLGLEEECWHGRLSPRVRVSESVSAPRGR